MLVYYNEYDAGKAAWLRELIKQNVIAPGVVDERSIIDVRPTELAGFTQVHLCAGIGAWSYALRLAGLPDSYPVWTCSEPCQPHSQAGKRLGDADERYIRWAIHHHIEHGKRPEIPVYGEQVANGDGLAWLDTLSADMEGAGHTVRAFDICSAGVGAPHIRQRLLWVADTELPTGARQRIHCGKVLSHEEPAGSSGGGSLFGLGHADSARREVRTRIGGYDAIEVGEATRQAIIETGFVRGFWKSARWIKCNDPKGQRIRPIEPSTFPLANGATARVLRLRGYGDCINAELAAQFIKASAGC